MDGQTPAEDKKLSHVNRGATATKPADGAGGSAGLDTMAEERVTGDGWTG